MSLRSHITDLAGKGYSRQEIFDSIRPQMNNYGITNPVKLAKKVLFFPTRSIWEKNKTAYRSLIALVSLNAFILFLSGISLSITTGMPYALAILFPLTSFIFLFFLITKRLQVLNAIGVLNIFSLFRSIPDIHLEGQLDYYVFGTILLLTLSIISIAFYLHYRMCKMYTVKEVKEKGEKGDWMTVKVISFPKEDKLFDEDVLI